ncbi:11911_t:CDS:2 [Funneliformis caledonium]|uniref:11911_t:CDS:1 n=1 Tax=Funneliformis caledonium TaxID=1117310 RepID=A0A9N9HF52_9GLOM|nr:11911_t:CDS:2 [Funneliformis caledonium]
MSEKPVYRRKSDKREASYVGVLPIEEELSKIEAYMADSQEEYEEETDLLPFDYNP